MNKRSRREKPPGAADASCREASALARASGIQERAAAAGFDWPDAFGPLASVREEADEVEQALRERAAPAKLANEVGDLFFAAVNVARAAGVDPRAALLRASDKFERRFRAVRELAAKRGLAMPGSPLESLDALWDEVKQMENRGAGAGAADRRQAPG